jgi:hypothetical protein
MHQRIETIKDVDIIDAPRSTVVFETVIVRRDDG